MSEEAAPKRLISMDAYRGFVMLLMMAEVLHLSRMAEAFPDNAFWSLLAFHTTHVEWVGCSLHDLIQPSFSFLVGVALPFSLASRMARGESVRRMTLHALWRAVLLILLGVFLRSLGKEQTNWTFEDTLTQIGLGYPFLFLFGFWSQRARWGALAVILVGYWAAWALYPAPQPGFDYAHVGVPPEWPHHATGFAAHWNKNSNLGAAFDQAFLNLFPRPEPFVANRGGYLTLSFIPTLGTMLLGLIAGGWLRTESEQKLLMRRLVLAGVSGLALGLVLSALGICPLVKRIWTPTWVLFSGGWCFLLLAGFYAIIDWRGKQRWAFPLVVIGMNSIAAYLIAHLFEEFIASNFKTHLGQEIFDQFGEAFGPTLQGAVVLLIYWLLLWWMYRRRLFLKI
ncbi:MAG: acyltransferase family protein [Actinomycetota bacterium]